MRAMRVVLTTGRERSLANELEAQQLAARYGLDFTPRADRRIEALAAQTGAEVIGVFGADGLVLHREGVKLRFSAGMAELRIQRVLAGEHEPLVQLAELKPGDTVLDGTLGLARDALVMAAAGARIDGLEGRPLIAAFCEAGLRVVGGAAGEVASRVSVRLGQSPQAMGALEARSYDVVYLDPMFGDEVAMPPEYELFRSIADPTPMDRDVVHQARRLARRAVILKDGPRGNALKTLGVPLKALTFGTRVRYARIDPY
jgi:hypothetical protein